MTRRTRVLMIISILVIALVAVFIYLVVYNKPHVDVSKSSADISLVSNTIVEDFEKDENQANAKYLEQIIQVTGTISELSTENDKGIVVLGTSDSFGSVMCHLSSKESQKIKTLKNGQQVTIKGICTGYLMDVILVKCVIVN